MFQMTLQAFLRIKRERNVEITDECGACYETNPPLFQD